VTAVRRDDRAAKAHRHRATTSGAVNREDSSVPGESFRTMTIDAATKRVEIAEVHQKGEAVAGVARILGQTILIE
jgi:hypothetical protein